MTIAVLEAEQESRGHADAPDSTDPRFCRSSTIFWLVLVAFAVRLSFLLLLKTYQYDRIDDNRITGEITNIAASIVRGHGFSSPFNDVYTGPTAWIAPAYPYFVALVFRYFGLMTRASVIFILTVQSLLSALTIIPMLGIARRTVGRRAGLWAALTWCLFPWFSKWSVTWLWETSLSALLVSLLFWYALSLPESFTRKSWMGFGALFGFALLTNPALCAFLPVSLAWCCYEMRHRKREWLKPALTSLLVCLIVISPWLIRNRVIFGQWVFLRSNFGFEFALGNYHSSLGRGWGMHPSGYQTEFNKYRQMGEIAYIRSNQEQAFQFVRDSPLEFLTLTAKRVMYFWDGSAMYYLGTMPWYWLPSSFLVMSLLLLPALLVAHRRNLHAWQMFFGALLLYPLPYYLTFSQMRYRHAIEPIILLLIVYAGVESAGKCASFYRAFRGRAAYAFDTRKN
jgi:4-amino-4-deoxy-L-arabinose transferase-like glycosyltransferase